MDAQAELLSKIEAFVIARKMAETTFGRMAVNDGKFVGRLRAGANMTLHTLRRAHEYIETHSASAAA